VAVNPSSITSGTDTGASATVSVTTSESPTTTKVGDFVLVIHCNDFYALSNMAAPTATGSPTVNAISGAVADGGANEAHLKAYWYIVNTAGAQVISTTETGTHDEEKSITAYVLTGVDTTNPIDDATNNTSSTATPTSQVAPAANPSTANAYLICQITSGGGAAAASYTTPSPLTEQFEIHAGSISGVGATNQLSASGSTGTFTFTASGSTAYSSVTIAIRTASASGAVAVPNQQIGPGRISPAGRWQQFPFSSDAATAVINVTDIGTGADAVTIVVTVLIADTGSAADAVAVAATVPLTDVGSATDATVVSATVPVAESGSGVDAPTETATVPLTDTGTGADAIAAGVPIGVGDSGSGSDAAGITATVPIAETGTASDAITVTVTLGIADSGMGTDAPTTLAALALAEAASALDALGITAVAPLTDAGTGADAIGVQTGGAIVKNIAESGSGRDRIHVLVQRPGSGTTTRPATGTTTRPNTGITYYQ
jgi:hypothetical protein